MTYSSPTNNPIASLRRDIKSIERRVNTANSPSGTQAAQTVQKLQAAVETLQVQQNKLDKQQTVLTDAVNSIGRITPDPNGQEQTTGSVSVAVGQTVNVHTFQVSIPLGKTQAFVAFTARAFMGSHDAIGLLEIFEDSTMVASQINYTPAGGGSSGVTFTTVVNANHEFSFRIQNPSGNTAAMSLSDLQSYFSVIYFADGSIPVVPDETEDES